MQLGLVESAVAKAVKTQQFHAVRFRTAPNGQKYKFKYLNSIEMAFQSHIYNNGTHITYIRTHV